MSVGFLRKYLTFYCSCAKMEVIPFWRGGFWWEEIIVHGLPGKDSYLMFWDRYFTSSSMLQDGFEASDSP